MIEWGALLGAMTVTLASLTSLIQSRPSENSAMGCLAVFVLGPIFGALWGAIVAAAIHYVADGAAVHLLAPFFHKH
jgi:hypothetical protein